MSANEKKVYLAGKVTGLSEEQVIKKFQQKEKELTEKGYQVMSPVEQIWAAGVKNEPWATIMRVCIQMLMNCDELHLLPDWADSKGARLEREIAMRLVMKTVYH